VAFALKHQRVSNIRHYLKLTIPWINEVAKEGGFRYAEVVIKYLLDGADGPDVQLFIEIANQYFSEELRGVAMTLAQQFEQMGYTKGLEQGKTLAQQFEQKGYAEGIRQVAQKLLNSGMSISTVAEVTDLSEAELNKIMDTEAAS
jgi:flagellar biosynthesis/type III secretory pathway protein FliH